MYSYVTSYRFTTMITKFYEFWADESLKFSSMQTLNKIRGHERIMLKKNTQNNVRVLANLPKNQKD